jgi:rRNA maturation endonuclease Nob1
MGVQTINMDKGFIDIFKFQKAKSKSKKKMESELCKICGNPMKLNGPSDRPKICKLCGEKI